MKNYFVTCYIRTSEIGRAEISTHVELFNPADSDGKIAQQLMEIIPSCQGIINFWEE